MSDGFIKLNRSILNWEWIDDPNTLRLWIQLLCTVNWGTSRYRGIELGPGQRIASLSKLAEELPGMSLRSIRTAKQHLIDTGSVTVTDTPYGDVVTVVNWAKYQVQETASDTEIDTGADKAMTRQLTQDRHEKEEREELKNNYYLGAHAHAPATTKEEKPKEEKRAFDVNDGREVRPGIWFPSVRPVTPEEKRANALKCREVFRAYRAKLEGGHDDA